MMSDLKISTIRGRSIPSLGCFGRLQRLSLQSNLTIPDLSAFQSSSRETLIYLRFAPRGFKRLLSGTPAGRLDLLCLRFLNLVKAPTDDILALMEHLHAPCLRTLCLSIQYKDDALTSHSGELLAQRALFRILARAPFVETLSCFRFTFRSRSHVIHPDSPAASTTILDIIRPLSTLRAL